MRGIGKITTHNASGGLSAPDPIKRIDRFMRLKGSLWHRRWEAMMQAYNPWRSECFDRMLSWPQLDVDARLRVLDLGCGAGPLAFRARKRFSRARIWAVDFDPLLLALARRENQSRGARIHFLQADLRRDAFWDHLPQRFDLVVSAVALHWLSRRQLAHVHARIHAAMAGGAWFLNADHVAAADPVIQERYRARRAQRHQALRTRRRACDWDGFWTGMQRELSDVDVTALRRAEDYWAGSDDGLPLTFHRAALRRVGFDPVACLWQDKGDALIAARRPAMPRGRARNSA